VVAEAPRAWDVEYDDAATAPLAAESELASRAEAVVESVTAAESVPSDEQAAGEELPVAPEPPFAEPAAADEARPREGGAIDQAEMRRRIEETRARLKAKAFDAMMSGEAALLSRESGDKPVPQSDEHGLDAETDSAIDESLSQEDY
jgi:hypothetical protein